MGNGGISRSFDFALNPRAKWEGGVVLDGKPLAANPSYELAMFYIDQGLLAKSDPNALKRVLVIDAQGNKNRFDFEGVTQPDKIDPAEFTFTPPPGTDLKRQGP
jgi:outer membrane lipoprotein carrier protein